VDSEPLHFACWREVLAPFGFQPGWDDYAANCIGVADREMIRRLCRMAGRDDWFDAVWAEYPRKKQLFRERAAANPPMPDSTREWLLGWTGCPLAVVSSSGRLEIEPVLDAAGVRGIFATVVTGDDVSRLKPHPDPYLLAAGRLSARWPLVVEDSTAGLASAAAAGFPALRIPDARDTARLLDVHLR
jgi:HAD superfamily hydrolase (TIGR01509 family)